MRSRGSLGFGLALVPLPPLPPCLSLSPSFPFRLWWLLPPPLFGSLGVGPLLPSFVCRFSASSSFFLVVFSSVSCVLVSSLGFRVAPSSFLASPLVALASPFVRFPWCGPPAPFFCLSFLRVLVVFLALFFVCLARLAPLSVSVSLPPPSRAETRSKRLFPAPFGLAFLSFSSVSFSGLV